MENRIYDERNGLWYAKQGDYYLPELALPSEKEKPIGIWGGKGICSISKSISSLFILIC